MTAVELAAHSGASVLAGAHVPKRPQCWRPAARSGVWDHSAIVASWAVTMVLHADSICRAQLAWFNIPRTLESGDAERPAWKTTSSSDDQLA
jgi:hypothetical protein